MESTSSVTGRYALGKCTWMSAMFDGLFIENCIDVVMDSTFHMFSSNEKPCYEQFAEDFPAIFETKNCTFDSTLQAAVDDFQQFRSTSLQIFMLRTSFNF